MTANEWILAALKAAGWLRVGATAIPNEYWVDALEDANRLLKAWAAEGILVPWMTEDTKVLTVSDGSYTWGSGGNITTTRPSRIITASIRWSDSTETPMRVVSQAEWSLPFDRTQTGTPDTLMHLRGTSTDTINIKPLPDAAYTLVMWSDKPQGSLSAPADTVTCPGEMEDALVYGLAVRRRIALGAPVSQDLAGASLTAKERVVELAAMQKVRPVNIRERRNIYTG